MNTDSHGYFYIIGAGFCLSCDHRLFWQLLHAVWASQQDAPNIGKTEFLNIQTTVFISRISYDGNFLSSQPTKRSDSPGFYNRFQTRVSPGLFLCVDVAQESIVSCLCLPACCLSVANTSICSLCPPQLRSGEITNEGINISEACSLCVHVAQQEGTVRPLSACLLYIANTSLFKEVHTAAPVRRDIPTFLTNSEFRVHDLTGIRGQCNCTLCTFQVQTYDPYPLWDKRAII